MKCPDCSNMDTKVIDTRSNKDGCSIRRRRECLVCKRRFTTYEEYEHIPIMIVKKDGRREVFNRDKICNGIIKSCEKRNISLEIIEKLADDLEKELIEEGEREVASNLIGEKVIKKLHDIDAVAYVRFASVYREFKDVNDFMEELKEILIKDKQ